MSFYITGFRTICLKKVRKHLPFLNLSQARSVCFHILSILGMYSRTWLNSCYWKFSLVMLYAHVKYVSFFLFQSNLFGVRNSNLLNCREIRATLSLSVTWAIRVCEYFYNSDSHSILFFFKLCTSGSMWINNGSWVRSSFFTVSTIHLCQISFSVYGFHILTTILIRRHDSNKWQRCKKHKSCPSLLVRGWRWTF